MQGAISLPAMDFFFFFLAMILIIEQMTITNITKRLAFELTKETPELVCKLRDLSCVSWGKLPVLWSDWTAHKSPPTLPWCKDGRHWTCQTDGSNALPCGVRRTLGYAQWPHDGPHSSERRHSHSQDAPYPLCAQATRWGWTGWWCHLQEKNIY